MSELEKKQPVPQNECNIISIKKEKNNSEERDSVSPEHFDQKNIIDDALSIFDSEVEPDVRERIVEEYRERTSTKSFKVPTSVAKIMAACDWYRRKTSSLERIYAV